MNDVTKDLLEAMRRIADPRNTHFAGDAQVVAREAIARAEAAQAEPQPDADDWIPWAGGEHPVDPDALVRVRFADFLEEGLPSRPIYLAALESTQPFRHHRLPHSEGEIK